MSARVGVPRQRSPLADMQPSRLSVASTAGAVVVATISSPSQCAATALQRVERNHDSDGGAEEKPQIYKILVLGILDVLRSAPELGHGRPNRLQTIATFGGPHPYLGANLFVECVPGCCLRWGSAGRDEFPCSRLD